jgi:predicted acylesterase/phospholipase RssA
MKVKNAALRLVVNVKNPLLKLLRKSKYGRLLEETVSWSFKRLPPGFTLPLAALFVAYFVMLYPLLVYKFVPWLLAWPAYWAHVLFKFGAVSRMGCDWPLTRSLGCVGAAAATVYHQLLDIAAALLTLTAALAGVVVSHGLACFCYRWWRALTGGARRRGAASRVARPAPAAAAAPGATYAPAHNPLERFQRIGIILAGGGAKGAYQAGAMKAIYEFLEGHGARDKVKMIAGTSIGSWNALFWLADMVSDAGADEGGRRIPGALESWWRGVSVAEIIKPVRYLPTRQNFLLSNEPWQDTFRQLFGEGTEGGRRLLEHMDDPDDPANINFYFTCTNIEQARLEVTTNDNERVTRRDPYLRGTDKLKNMTAKIARTLEELRFGVFSSMDLPPLFEYAAGVNGNGGGPDFYEDGGVIDNLPIYFGTEVEECDLLFILPLNASFEQEVNHRSLIRRLARVTSIRQGVLERKAFKDIYLFNEMAYLRELAHRQEAALNGVLAYLEGNEDAPPGAEELADGIRNVLVPVAPEMQRAKDLSPLQRALMRKHKPVQVFSICPAPKLKINTAEFWKTEEAGAAFDLMYDATRRGLEQKFEWLISQNFVTMVQVPDRGDPVPFTDF